MWTETHYYCFPDQESVFETPDAAVDHVGLIEGAEGWHVNVRWLSEQPEAWEAYRIPTPNNPVREFA